MSVDERLARIAGIQRADGGSRSGPAVSLPDSRRRGCGAEPQIEPRIEPVVTVSHNLDHRHGHLALGALLATDTGVLDRLGGDLGVSGLPTRETVFLDTETTGLGGGAGCLVFLVGLGWFSDDGFVVEQHTLMSPAEEESFLGRIAARLAGFRAVATFFGKAFDRPRLEDRFAFHRMGTRLPADPHADLHALGRRIWGNVLPDCRLATIERAVLGFERVDDLPGALCPEAYRSWLHGDAYLLGGVLEHNLNDILSLAVLAEAVCRQAIRPTTQRGRLAVARGHDRLGATDRAVELLREACDRGREFRGSEFRGREFRETEFRETESRGRELGGEVLGHADATAAIALGELLKRRGRRPEAVDHWTAMAAAGEGGAYPHLELAKYSEHHAREPERALEHALRAAAVGTRAEQAAIEHRTARLRRKCGDAPTQAP